MTLYGLDISNHQGNAVNIGALPGEGFSFLFAKSSEGPGYTDPYFTGNMNDARNAGLVFAAYHYVRPGDVHGEVARIRSVVPLDCPVCLDVEAGSGGMVHLRGLVNALRDAGYRVPLLYLPPWYWQQIGSPGLGGLPPLWCSRWPDNNGGYASQIYARTPASYWNGYGGLPVAVLQFTANATAAGYSPLDANAFEGTRAELEALVYGQQEDDVEPWASEMLKHIHWCFTGTYDPAEYTGHPNKIDGTPVSWLDYTRWNDVHSLHEAGRAAGRTQAMRELLAAAQANTGSYDREAVKARIKDAINAKIAAEVVGRVSVEVTPPVEEPPSA